MILFQIPSLTLHVISLYTKLLPPKFQDVSFVLQMPKQTAININFKIRPPSLSFTSLFPHSLKITLLSSSILFTTVYFHRYALYQGNLLINHPFTICSLNQIAPSAPVLLFIPLTPSVLIIEPLRYCFILTIIFHFLSFFKYSFNIYMKPHIILTEPPPPSNTLPPQHVSLFSWIISRIDSF